MAINLQDRYLDEAAKEMADDIDWEIMAGFMTEIGWTKIVVDFGSGLTESDAHEIKEWIRGQCKGTVRGRKNQWMFEDSKDATLFSLRWGR